MDLGNLLNRSTPGLSYQELVDLIKEKESSVKLDRIDNPTFVYPSRLEETYAYFDLFIQLLLSIQYDDDAFGFQYSKTVIVTALRACISGLLQQHGLPWVLGFPQRTSRGTWRYIQQNQDNEVTVYLYGLVLALAGRPDLVSTHDWVSSLAHFCQTGAPPVIAHVIMNCWCFDDKQRNNNSNDALLVCLDSLETALRNTTLSFTVVDEALSGLSRTETDLLSTAVDERLGSALWRDPFKTYELGLAWNTLGLVLRKRYNDYPQLARAFFTVKHRTEHQNPLKKVFEETPQPTDHQARIAKIQEGIACWRELLTTLPTVEFELYMIDAIKTTYPVAKKSMLDVILAEWTLYHASEDVQRAVIETLLERLGEKPYNMRTAPYYAFVQLFRPEADPERVTYNVRTGAKFDTAGMIDDEASLIGANHMLKKLSEDPSANAQKWLSDCIYVASPAIVQAYVLWLTEALNEAGAAASPTTAQRATHLQTVLGNPHVLSFASTIVPVFLQRVSDISLRILMHAVEPDVTLPGLRDMVAQYFARCSQVSSHALVQDLLRSKPKIYFDHLLALLKDKVEHQGSASAAKSSSWFQDHFLEPILSLTASSKTDEESRNSVAAQLFRQVLTDQEDFALYLGTPFADEGDNDNDTIRDPSALFEKLDLIKTHSILPVRDIGLVRLLQHMVRMGHTHEQERDRLVQTWYRLWVTEDEASFVVPTRCVLQCIGLYDQAPATIKSMIADLIQVGLRQSEHSSLTAGSFITSMMDLLMLADIPEPDRVLGLLLNQSDAMKDDTVDQTLLDAILTTLVELAEELALAVRGQKMQSTRTVRKTQKRRKTLNQARREMADMARVNNATTALTLLTQRAVAFLSALIPSEYLDTSRRRIRDKLVHHIPLYEALAHLHQLLAKAEPTLRDDLQDLIHACVTLAEPDADRVRRIHQVLAMYSLPHNDKSTPL
ncbi:hypothetical protein BCR43DRAFT_495110 [Syncephalastrum racemosum]|uniref:Uncharacterized protein n=1 Tax=Syncephalastrum racemosum TaxID=13706 RepID=A0A1X2H935_SYNRA|nr:hypothetical protein BCR43DRAFT_495110 [Syncephalastrum racemosum]